MEKSFTAQLIEEQNAKADTLKKRYIHVDHTLAEAEALYQTQCEIATELEEFHTLIKKLKDNIKKQYEITDDVRTRLRVLQEELAEEMGHEEG